MIYYYFQFGGRHIELNLAVFMLRHRPLCQRVGAPWKHGSSFWNLIPSYNTTQVITTYGLAAAILNFTYIGNSYDIEVHAIAPIVHGNMGVAFGISLESSVEPEI